MKYLDICTPSVEDGRGGFHVEVHPEVGEAVGQAGEVVGECDSVKETRSCVVEIVKDVLPLIVVLVLEIHPVGRRVDYISEK